MPKPSKPKTSKHKRMRRLPGAKVEGGNATAVEPGHLASTAQLMTAARLAVLAKVPASFEFEGRTYLLRVQRIAMVATIATSADPERPIVTMIADRANGAAPGVPIH